jgi:alpha-tubulin suppressor-like RCC1 family protein
VTFARTRAALLVAATAAALVGAPGTGTAAPSPVRPVDPASPVMSIAEARAQGGFGSEARAPLAARTAAAPAAAPGSGGSAFTSMRPTRVLDTRNSGGALGAGGVRTVDLPSRVPANATAVVLNVTGVTPTLSTVITVWPAGEERPAASTLNLRAREIRANAATVALGPERALAFRNNAGSAHVVADLAGYYAPAAGSRFTSTSPTRVLDTRNSGGALGPGATRTLNLSSRVPATATAVTFNLTGASTTANTVVTAYPSGQTRPVASSLNMTPGQVTPNLVTVALGANRSVTLHNNAGNTHLVVDLAGYYATDRGDVFYQVSPLRWYDTRSSQPLNSDYIWYFDFPEIVPASASALVFNMTGTSPTTSMFVTAWPGETTQPTASNLNLVRGQTAANMATVPFGPDKRLNITNNSGSVHVIIDVAGYFSPPPVACTVNCVHSWGANNNAQLGIGTMGGFSGEPNRVDGNSGFTAVAGGVNNGYGLREGRIWAWGTNGASGLANDLDYGVATTPVRISGVSNIRQIAIGAYTGYAIDSAKRTWAWGYGGNGELGDGFATNGLSVVSVSLPNDVVQVAAGHLTTFALRENGTVWVWGANGGSFGNGTYGTGCDTTPVGAGCRAGTPIQVPGLTGVVSIATSYNAAFAVKSDGTVWAWGWNAEGELGIGTAGGPDCYANPLRTNCMALSPVQIPGLTGVSKIVTGGTSTTYALMNDGTVQSWGYNAAGQLGNGTTGGECEDETTPNCVRTTPGPVTGLTDVADVAAGGGFALARRTDGTLWTWGQNSQGQLGGQWSPTDVPTQVPGVSGVTSVGAGLTTAYAIY